MQRNPISAILSSVYRELIMKKNGVGNLQNTSHNRLVDTRNIEEICTNCGLRLNRLLIQVKEVNLLSEAEESGAPVFWLTLNGKQ